MDQALTIVPYDPRWPAGFTAEAERIRAALGALALRVDHNGSTAVPGLAAKPVIDIQISVADLAPIDRYRVPLESIGYVHVPHADDAFCPYFHKPREWPHSHHVHVVRAGDAEERRTLAFRDYLRAHPDAAGAYAELKKELATQFSAADSKSREAYANAKTAFIERIIIIALRDGHPRTL
ncbi:MAG TPA: GrpB family protein [Candidatus Kryptonia bacterium]|nr:GrpB family protein [Candidatus Kryptonia bacterium]